MFKKARTLISFIDLLACALGASILLMLVFAKSKEDAAKAESIGAPKDFMYCEIELQQPQAYVIFQVRPKGGVWRKLQLNNNAQLKYHNGFINLTNNALHKMDSYYACGPFYKKNGESYQTNKSFFGIYGVHGKNESNWEFSASYISDQQLDWKSTAALPDKIISTQKLPKINLVYRLRNKNSTALTEKKIALAIGETQVFTIKITNED
ncbi:hypothetical protein P8625_15695 [Tenacibaculum tangerinum]|uniref:Uncharacterized protein n=1 Tax=Tenacibaculum tangerinum TaxID=3038772 RepID=A0ABY8L215_9FLAO|nr:hypothetical protein [Tenacibaculum tangerinum]WGH75488.1 hypothetical protein P8625_15695 [Tenacibaculum tangerinum]